MPALPPPEEPEEPRDPRRIYPDDPTLKVVAIHLRKQAESLARVETARLIEEAKRQAGEPPQRDL
jgi:hypothetical protein